MRHYAVLMTILIIVLLVNVNAVFAVPVANSFRLRSLRTHIKADGGSEERAGMPVSSVEKIKNLFTSSKISEEVLQRWLKNGKSADNVFGRLQLTNAGEKLFDNPQFVTWLKYVDELYAKQPLSEVSTISTLTSYYGDQALSQMIIAAQKIPSTQTLATELQTKQLKYWLSDKTAPADVYKLLMLNKAGDKLLDNPQFLAWFSYVDDFNKIRRKTKSRMSILTTYYGDEALSKMLIEANKVPNTTKIAGKLQTEQIQGWFATQTSPGDVFKYLMLNKAGENLLDTPQFLTWVKYVDDLNKANPDKKTTLMSVLSTHYTTENLTKMLENGRKASGSKKLVKRLENEQKWLTKDTPDELFKRLKLDKAGAELLDSPQLKTWTT